MIRGSKHSTIIFIPVDHKPIFMGVNPVENRFVDRKIPISPRKKSTQTLFVRLDVLCKGVLVATLGLDCFPPKLIPEMTNQTANNWIPAAWKA